MHDVALLILGHGSRDDAANAEIEAIVEAVRARRRDLLVTHAWVELARPSLAEALDDAASRARRVVVVPLFLFAAGHVKNDVPLALEAARAKHPRVAFSAATALGVHPALARLAYDRAAQAIPIDEASAKSTALVLVGRGSSDPDANGDFCKLARLVAEGRGLMLVEPTFMGITRPRVEETLEQVARARPERIVLVPYLLAAGRIASALRDRVEAFRARYPWIATTIAAHLGGAREVLDLVDERAEAALRGVSTLACDACVYRAEMPGFARQVGGLRALLWSVRHTVTHAQTTATSHTHRPIKKHVLVCGNVDCAARGSLAVIEAVRRTLKRAGMQREVRVTRTSCMGRCGEGPAVVVYPDGVWYRGVREEDAADLVGEHLASDRLVTRLVDDVM